MPNPAALLFTVFSIVADAVRPVRVNGSTVGYRVAIGRCRLHVDSTEVSVWMTGAGACLVTLYRADSPATSSPATSSPAGVLEPTACTAPARRRVNVWRSYPRPVAVRLAGVA